MIKKIKQLLGASVPQSLSTARFRDNDSIEAVMPTEVVLPCGAIFHTCPETRIAKMDRMAKMARMAKQAKNELDDESGGLVSDRSLGVSKSSPLWTKTRARLAYVSGASNMPVQLNQYVQVVNVAGQR